MTNKQAIEGLNRLSNDIDNAHNGGVITDEQHRELKAKAKEAAMGNIFAMMAQYCK